jgi:hypothetical protein
MFAAEFVCKRPNFSVGLAEIICQALATLLVSCYSFNITVLTNCAHIKQARMKTYEEKKKKE